MAAGEFVALLGANGSGKTTLAKHLNGLLKPARGSVRVNGRDTQPMRVAELARQVGYVFRTLTTRSSRRPWRRRSLFGLHLQGLSAAEVGARVDWALTTFGLQPYRSVAARAARLGAKGGKSPLSRCLQPSPRCLSWTSQLAAWTLAAGMS